MRRGAWASGRRVLVVDDDPDVRWITAAFLEEVGCDTVEAGGGGEALAVLAADPGIVVLVTDHAMPGMDGTELISRARGLRPDLPALVVTGHAGAGGLARLPGDVPVLRKPFRQEELLRALDRLCAPTSQVETTAPA